MMSTNLRRLGVFGANNPTKKTKTVRAADFLIGGIIGQFERKYDKTFSVANIEEFQEIFGNHIDSSFFGSDVVKGFFDNIVGVDAKAFIKSHVGFDGTVIDAVTATLQLDDQAGSPLKTLQLDDAFENELAFGLSGNRTGHQIVNGDRFTTLLAATAIAAATSLVLDSVAGVIVGDILKVVLTGGGGATVFHKILTVTEATNTVTFTGPLHASAPGVIGDAVSVIGFQLKTFRKSSKGVVTEVEVEKGKIFCTMEPEVTDFYVVNVHSTNKFQKATDLASASADNLSFPADVSTTTFLASGADGTTPTSAAHWSRDITKFADDPIRFLCNAEDTDIAENKAGETAMKARDDQPKWIYNLPSDRTKAQLIALGNQYQRSDDVLGVIAANHVEVTDPFATSTIAPDRVIPSVGHTMGAWCRVIGLFGIHFVPAIDQIPIFGINAIKGDQLLNDTDRTDVAEAGVNVLQFVQGVGFKIANFFTPSTTTEFQFGNGILMREFIKVSAVDSLASSENTPNSIKRIREDVTAIRKFLRRLWDQGNTGNAQEGDTFGQSENPDGSLTVFNDHIEVQGDIINNPQSSLNVGERNYDIFFTFPTPAGSIRIGVGFILR